MKPNYRHVKTPTTRLHSFAWLRGLSSYLFLVPATVVFMAFIAYPIAWVSVESCLPAPVPPIRSLSVSTTTLPC